MSQFLGTHQNRLDAKGRVSVPASFRAALKAADPSGGGIVLRPSHTHPCIEGWPAPLFAALATPLEKLELFSEAHDDLSAALFADAYPVEPDREGRIVLAEPLAEHAALSDAVVFMGVGQIFQIWQPEAAERRRTEARARARDHGLTLAGLAATRVPS